MGTKTEEEASARNRREATTKRSSIEVTSEGSRQKRSEQTEEDLETKTEEEASARNRREATTKRSSIEVTSEGSRQTRETKEKVVKKIMKVSKKKFQKLGKSQ